MISRAAHPDRRTGLMLASVAAFLFLAVAGSVVLPGADSTLDATSPLARGDLSEEAERGLTIYRSEGCWYCHTQQVRTVSTDRGLGSPLAAGDYPATGPAMLGAERIGSDLTHVGARLDEQAMRTVLRGRRRAMPSYAHLSADDVAALTAYLRALE